MIELMIDAMNDTLILEDDKDEEEFELNTKTSHRYGTLIESKSKGS